MLCCTKPFNEEQRKILLSLQQTRLQYKCVKSQMGGHPGEAVSIVEDRPKAELDALQTNLC